MEESIQSILSSAEPPTEEPKTEAPAQKEEPKAESPKETKPETVRDEHGRFTKQDDKPEKPKVNREVAGIIDERRKRQELEVELAKLREAKPKTDIWEDPEKAISERLDEKLQPLQARYFNLSMKTAQRLHEDFQEVAEVFAEKAQSDSRLVQAMRESDDPGEYIYTVGLQLKELGDVGGDFAKYKEKVTGELKAELAERDTKLAAMAAELDALKKQQSELAAIPRSLNRGSEPAPRSIAESDPDDLKSLVRFGNKS